MSASARSERLHRAYLCLGSNIEPEGNMRRAVCMLREHAQIISISTCWETEAIRGEQTGRSPNFLNAAACVLTPLDAAKVKARLLAPIEQALGRVRTADKYAPRTIDLDLTLFDEQVLDDELWRRVYMALIFSELLPDLRNPLTGETLVETAVRLRGQHLALAHPEILLGRPCDPEKPD